MRRRLRNNAFTLERRVVSASGGQDGRALMVSTFMMWYQLMGRAPALSICRSASNQATAPERLRKLAGVRDAYRAGHVPHVPHAGRAERISTHDLSLGLTEGEVAHGGLNVAILDVQLVHSRTSTG